VQNCFSNFISRLFTYTMKPLYKNPSNKKSVVGSTSNLNKSFGIGGATGCKIYNDKHGKWLLKQLNQLRLKEDMTDITFNCNHQKIRANRVVLAAASPTLCNLLINRENQLNAEILPPDTLEEAVNFIYSASLEVTVDGLMRLKHASELLEMPIVHKMCINALMSIPRQTIVSSYSSLNKSSMSLTYNAEKISSNDLKQLNDFNGDEASLNPRKSIKMTFHSNDSLREDTTASVSSADEPLTTRSTLTDGSSSSMSEIDSSFPIRNESEANNLEMSTKSLIENIPIPFLSSSPSQILLDKNIEQEEQHRATDTFTIAFKSKVLPGFLKSLNSLREEGIFCDLIFIVGNTRIHCHRCVIAASSSVFYAILKRIKIKEIILKKIEDTSLIELINYVYTGQSLIERENVVATMRAANRFRFHHIAQQCSCFLERNANQANFFLSVDNVLVTYKLTNVYGCPRFREECYKFIINKFWDVVKLPDFYDLSLNELNRIVTNEGLTHTRLQNSSFDYNLFIVLNNWLKNKPERQLKMTSSVLKFVNFDNIDAAILKKFVTKSNVAMSDEMTHQRVTQAMENQIQKGASITTPSEITTKEEKLISLISWKLNDQPKTFLSHFRPDSNKWQYMEKTPIRFLNYAVTASDGVLFVSGGQDLTATKFVSPETYMLIEGKWNRLPDMKVARYNHALGYHKNHLIAIGGNNNDQDSITSIEVLDLTKWKNDAKTKWKINKLCLPTPNACLSFNPIFLRLNSNKDQKSEKGKKSYGSRLGASSLQESVSSPAKSSSIKLKRVLSDRTRSNCTFLLMGGESCPRQNLQCDLNSGKLFVKRPIPQDCLHPFSVSCNSFIFVIPNDSADFSDHLLQYNPLEDVWTKLYNPFAVEISSMCSCLINYPKSTHANTSVSKIIAYERNLKLHVMVIQESTAAMFVYDSHLNTWSTPVATDLDFKTEGSLLSWFTYCA